MKHWNEKPSRLPTATVRRYPRTLQEAFGPYTDNQIATDTGFKWTPIRVAFAVVYALALVTLCCVLPGGAP